MIHAKLVFDPVALVQAHGAELGCTPGAEPVRRGPKLKPHTAEERSAHREYKRRWREQRRKAGLPV
jgi:hypothetical protein